PVTTLRAPGEIHIHPPQWPDLWLRHPATSRTARRARRRGASASTTDSVRRVPGSGVTADLSGGGDWTGCSSGSGVTSSRPSVVLAPSESAVLLPSGGVNNQSVAT